MIVDVGIVQVLNTRIALAFVDSHYVHPVTGQELLDEIRVRFAKLSHVPVMLYSEDGRGFAAFQTHEFAKRVTKADVVEWFRVDTDEDAWFDASDLPF